MKSLTKYVLLVGGLALSLTVNAAEREYETGRILNIQRERHNVSRGATAYHAGSAIIVNNNTSSQTHWNYIVAVRDMIFHGQYIRRNRLQQDPSMDFVINDPVDVRFDKNRMYLKRPNGKELKTQIVTQMRVPPQRK